jgi:bacterioferritin-associated ferredoxin
MIVCHCRTVSDRAVRREVVRGADDLESVVARCGAGGRCGGCRPALAALLSELLGRDPAPLVCQRA